MSGSPFSERTEALLRSAGWHEGRAVETAAWERGLAEEGYPVGEHVLLFLREFGGLRVAYEIGPDRRREWFHFDVLKTVSGVYPDVLGDYGRRIGGEVCPVGEAFHDHMVLCMDGRGAVYGGYDSFLCRVGSSGEDAIEALCSGRTPEEMPPDDGAGAR